MDLAYVVFIDGPSTVGAYFAADRCLDHAAQLARFVGSDVRIALYFGHSEWAWKGRGVR